MSPQPVTREGTLASAREAWNHGEPWGAGHTAARPRWRPQEGGAAGALAADRAAPGPVTEPRLGGTSAGQQGQVTAERGTQT